MNAAAPSGQAAAGSADALLGAVHWLCRHHGIERSADSLLDGLGVPRPLTPAGACHTSSPTPSGPPQALGFAVSTSQ